MSKNITKPYHYLNLKKENRIREVFTSVPEEKCSPAIFVTLTILHQHFNFRPSDRVKFFSMIWLSQVIYDVYLHYCSDIENISLQFLGLRHGPPSNIYNLVLFFFCILCMKECCDCSLVESFLKKKNFQSTFSYNRNGNERKNQSQRPIQNPVKH